MVLARLRRGVVGETRRVCHVVPVPDTNGVPDQLLALCGAVLRRGESEWLPSVRGMPCERCLAAVAYRARHRHTEVLRPAS
ncbi:hypothetical protein [Saccharomonospora cyanea]|uniref:hypothetical protein n=1 Tax=Saccharomonospora cyanea TaxID=40989 RepID=UPI00031FE3EA